MCLFDRVIGYIRHALADHPIFRRMKLLSCGRHGVKRSVSHWVNLDLVGISQVL